MITALIDADSIVYIVGWGFRDEGVFATDVVQKACDDFVRTILTLTQAEQYMGALSAKKCFRHDIYKYKPYKGSRPPAADFILKWKPVIEDHLTSKWGFYKSLNLEADDIVAALAVTKSPEDKVIICSPDKDLRQIPGYHFDYRVNAGGIQTVDEETAIRNFWSQMLIGDTTDNIAGVPKMGEVKVRKLFDEAEKGEKLSNMTLHQVVYSQYLSYFGPYYGAEIFDQTLETVMMLRPEHKMWPTYAAAIAGIQKNYIYQVPVIVDTEDEAVLNNLGWIS